MNDHITQKLKLSQKQPCSGATVFSQERDWWPSDSEESFHRMMQHTQHREYFQALGWDKPGAITYKFNSLGFRGEEINRQQPNLCTFGCSFTMGIGLPQDKVWPWLVGTGLNLKVHNFALGGVSADWCFRMAEYYLRCFNPKLAVLCAPPPARTELIVDDQGQTHMYSAQEPVNDNFLKNWFANTENQRLNSIKNRFAFKALCDQLGIPCLTYDAHEWFGKSREEVGYARDYMHAGIPGHQYLADRIVNDWNEKYA